MLALLSTIALAPFNLHHSPFNVRHDFTMLSLFNIFRFAVFFTVMAWSLIVLGLSAFFDHLIISSDMTRYVPFAIFLAVCTLIIIPTLLIAGSFKRIVLSQVRCELAFAGLLGLMWLILGLSTASAEDSIVTCDFDGSGDFVESDEYSTDMYHEQLRVLRAFSLFNAILLLGFFLVLLFLACRQHLMGRTLVWTSRTTIYPWFGGAPEVPSKEWDVSQESLGLPQPVTSKDGVTIAKMPKGTTTLSGDSPMNAGGHYIIYIPPPA